MLIMFVAHFKLTGTHRSGDHCVFWFPVSVPRTRPLSPYALTAALGASHIISTIFGTRQIWASSCSHGAQELLKLLSQLRQSPQRFLPRNTQCVGQSLTGSRESGLHNVDQSLTSHLTVEQP